MIVVTGGTGRVGRQVVSQLAELGQPVRTVSRGARPGSGAAGTGLGSGPAGTGLGSGAAGTETVRADLAEPGSLEPHLRGAEC
jgi:uncharacterized protein YbjT (DUF2867 family)